MSTRKETDEERSKRLAGRATEIAQQILHGELGIIAGSRLLSSLGNRMVDDWVKDKDFVVFGTLESDTDHLPLEDQRKNWDSVAYERKQLEVAEFENSARERVLTACKSIVTRYGGV